jgi:hypothetical protein
MGEGVMVKFTCYGWIWKLEITGKTEYAENQLNGKLYQMWKLGITGKTEYI